MSKEQIAESISNIELAKLKPFRDHPFSIRDDDAMQQTVESVRAYGVLVPAIARPLEDGSYELISGHRRKHACELAGLSTMPVIIRDIDRDAATIIMVDSNLQRDSILPSERAKAYKMKLDAIKRQGARHDLTSTQVAQKLSVEKVAEEAGTSKDHVRRYIRLNELQPELQKMVDDGKIGMTPAVELSYLKPHEQRLLIETIDSEQATPSLSQAQRMKRLSQEGRLTDDSMLGIMMEQKKPENWNLSLPMDKIKKYFPRSYTPQRMEETIIKLLESWMKKRQRDQQR
jgi:ParB-like partition proteins